MNFGRVKKLSEFCFVTILLLSAVRAGAFALLGPYENWMQPSNNFRLPVNFAYGYPPATIPAENGGPMAISNGYRWNVPVVTYGFDASFLNYFGSNGVAAVQAAVQMLSEVPPASAIELSNYSDFTLLTNAHAAAAYL